MGMTQLVSIYGPPKGLRPAYIPDSSSYYTSVFVWVSVCT